MSPDQGEKLSQEIIEILSQAKRINPGIGGWNGILVAEVQEAENQWDEIDETGNVPEERLCDSAKRIALWANRNSNVSLD